MGNHLAEDVLSVEMLTLMKVYQKTLDVPENLNASVRFLEVTSQLVGLFLDCHRPIHYMENARLDSIKEMLTFFPE